MSQNVICLEVPYEMREEAKKNKCFFSPETKKWTCRLKDNDSQDKKDFVNKYIHVYLDVSFDEKDDVKEKGGKWDSNTKLWYTYKGNSELQEYM